MNMRREAVEILCHECKEPTTKSLAYLVRRVRQRKTDFFCSRKCTDINHAQKMTGTGNPNFGGTFHGQVKSDWSEEKCKTATIKMIATRKINGTHRGEKNGRWAGGRKESICCICGKTSTHSPYIYRKIIAGQHSPCCSRQCATINAQRHIKSARTSIEIKMAEALSQRSIEYIEQYHLGNKFSLDFFLPEYDIVIECDGDYWHRLPAVVKRDRSKNAYIAACGYPLFRFWESEINECVDACVDIVMAEINIRETC